jgi:hypothetical protein
MLTNISCRLLAIDEGRQLLSLIDTATSTFHWMLDLADYPLARDLQRLDRERVLVGFDRGYFELEIETGKVLAVCDRWTDVTAVHRRADGSTLVTGWDLDESEGVNVLTLDRDQRVADIARRDGDYVRLMRVTPAGTYLLCTNDHILETTPDLATVRRFAAPGFEHAWMAERLPDGTTLVSAGYGAFMAVFDTDGNLMKRFGRAGQVPAEVAPFFYATFQRLANGHLLVANWQGHGPDNGAKGRQLLEFDRNHDLVGAWSALERISSLQGILPV